MLKNKSKHAKLFRFGITHFVRFSWAPHQTIQLNINSNWQFQIHIFLFFPMSFLQFVLILRYNLHTLGDFLLKKKFRFVFITHQWMNCQKVTLTHFLLTLHLIFAILAMWYIVLDDYLFLSFFGCKNQHFHKIGGKTQIETNKHTQCSWIRN